MWPSTKDVWKALDRGLRLLRTSARSCEDCLQELQCSTRSLASLRHGLENSFAAGFKRSHQLYEYTLNKHDLSTKQQVGQRSVRLRKSQCRARPTAYGQPVVLSGLVAASTPQVNVGAGAAQPERCRPAADGHSGLRCSAGQGARRRV